MKIPRKIFSELAEIVLEGGAVRATKFYDEHTVVSCKRKLFGGKVDKRSKISELLFKVGAPNFKERGFIKQCKKVGEPFPIKRIQLKFLEGQ